MNVHRIMTAGAALTLAFAFVAEPGWADRDRGNNDRREEKRAKQADKEQRKEVRREGPRKEVRREDHRPPPGYRLDDRHRHDRYYPPHGHVIPALPPGHRVVRHRGTHFYFHAGVWYRPSGTRFVVVMPPVGVVLPVLPPYHSIIWVHGSPYYYAAGVYYVWHPDHHGYVVSEPPPASDIEEQPAAPGQLFVYPKAGQSEELQARDRYECHRWGADQTGFDPTQPGGNVSAAEHAGKRADYHRAMKACLEARNYSVQ